MLLVDTDPQGDLTKSLGWKDPDFLETMLADHLAAVVAGEPLTPAEGILSHREGVDLMPANIERITPAELAAVHSIVESCAADLDDAWKEA